MKLTRCLNTSLILYIIVKQLIYLQIVKMSHFHDIARCVSLVLYNIYSSKNIKLVNIKIMRISNNSAFDISLLLSYAF